MDQSTGLTPDLPSLRSPGTRHPAFGHLLPIRCGGESASPPNAGASGASGQGGVGGVGGGGGRPGGASGVGGGAGGEEIRCGGADHLKCPEGYFCDDGACGLTGSSSTCLLLPQDCPALDETPVYARDATDSTNTKY